ncbi:MAG: hypothetical protein ACRBDL_04200 [Alphaproteobacteria bacterium]
MTSTPPTEEEQSFQQILSAWLWPQAAKSEEKTTPDTQNTHDTETGSELEVEPD